MKYFVSSDIHGFYNEWIYALNEKGFDINNPEHKIIVCGDLFDRGTQPEEIIRFILSNKEKFILIRGNHEDLMQDMINRNKDHLLDLQNGTSTTIMYLCPEWKTRDLNLKDIAIETGLQQVLDSCVNYYETTHYVFVHAWIPFDDIDYTYNEDWREANEQSWHIAKWAHPPAMVNLGVFEPNKTIVCGHRCCSLLWQYAYPDVYDDYDNANYEPFISDAVIGLDASTAYTYKVNVIVLED